MVTRGIAHVADHTRVGAWPRWLLIEDVAADDFVIENGGRMLVLYRDETVVDEARRVVVARLRREDIVAVEQLCGHAVKQRG